MCSLVIFMEGVQTKKLSIPQSKKQMKCVHDLLLGQGRNSLDEVGAWEVQSQQAHMVIFCCVWQRKMSDFKAIALKTGDSTNVQNGRGPCCRNKRSR